MWPWLFGAILLMFGLVTYVGWKPQPHRADG
jgi:hypothetical protein